MSAKGRLSKAEEAARAARNNQYLQRLIQDEELRSNLMTAYGSARSAYARMTNGKPAGRALLEDRKLQRELRETVEALRDASFSLREPRRRRRRRRGIVRMLLLVAIGATLALVLSEGLRSKVLDLMFGAEEEFDYSSTTTPPTPAPAPVSG
jgi:hypothetical protein